MRRLLTLLVLAAGLSATTLPAAAAQPEVYVSRNDSGVLTFSDAASPGARRVDVDVPEPADEPLAEMERRIEQTLAVARALETARLEREKARAEARARAAEARAAAAPVVIYQERHVAHPLKRAAFRKGHFHGHRGWRDRWRDSFEERDHERRHRDADRPRRQRSMSRTMLYDPD